MAGPGGCLNRGVAQTYQHGDFPADLVARAKAATGRTVSVCIPARDEGSTVGSVVRAVVQPFLANHGGNGLVDEVIVLDDGSADDTAEQAGDAGARVVRGPGGPGGKGRAMAAALEASVGDVVAFLDADVANTTPAFVTGLLGPLLTNDDVALVKGFYTRPLHGEPTGGGRVTELVARPVLELLFPELSWVRQPLAGETAGHRWVFEKVGFAGGYGVELGLLIDVARGLGADRIAQVDLGERIHRNRPLEELRPQAVDVLRAALARAEPSTPPART
jgi:glucosyl-3-phosphoglycerate synthase